MVVLRLADFLTDRTQSVVSCTGEFKKSAITPSTIQGSGIGPTGFIAMIADLQPISNTMRLCQYFNDITVLIPGSLVGQLHASEEVENIWLLTKQNRLIINTSKSK